VFEHDPRARLTGPGPEPAAIWRRARRAGGRGRIRRAVSAARETIEHVRTVGYGAAQGGQHTRMSSAPFVFMRVRIIRIKRFAMKEKIR